jgi:hypothetical protein
MPLGVLRCFATVILVLGLAGCFRSATPLIELSQAKFPFETMTLKNPEGQLSTLRRYSDVYRLIENGELGQAALLIAELAPDTYLVQSDSESAETEYLFARKQGDTLLVRADCKGVDPASLTRLGVEVRQSGETLYDCHFKDLQSLTEIEKSPGFWDNSTTTLQIVSIE